MHIILLVPYRKDKWFVPYRTITLQTKDKKKYKLHLHGLSKEWSTQRCEQHQPLWNSNSEKQGCKVVTELFFWEVEQCFTLKKNGTLDVPTSSKLGRQ